MGLNIHYTLLTENANNKFAMTEYKSIYLSPFFEQSYILEQINDVRQELANNQYELLYVFENVEAFNEGELWERISSNVQNIFRILIGAIRKFASIVSNAIKRFIRYIKSKLSPRPKEVVKLRDAEYIDILNKAIYENKPVVSIASIVPTDKLLDLNFPPAKLTCMDRIDYPVRELTYIMAGMGKHDINGVKDDLVDATKIDEDLADIKNLAVKELFGNDANKVKDIKNIDTSVSDLQIELFGSKEVMSVDLSIGLYQQAKENLAKSEEMIREMESLQRRIEDGYGRAVYSVARLSKQVEDRLATSHTITSGPFANQSKMLASITSIAQKCADAVSDIMNAHMQLATYKVQRLAQIYGPASGSARIQKICDDLVLQQIKKTEPNPTNEDVDIIASMIDEMNYEIEMARGFLIEASLSEDIRRILQEADGDNNQQNNAGSNNQQSSGGGQGKVAAFIDKITTAVANTFKNFSVKIQEVVVKMGDKSWWDNNKAKIARLNVDKVTVNQWYSFRLDRFKKSSYVRWDENNNIFNSDKETQNAIFNAIGGSPTVNEDASFTDKVKSLYYDNYVDNSTGEGKAFNTLGINRKDMDAFIEDFFNGTNGSILKSIKQELDEMNKDAKDVKARLKDNKANGNGATTQQQTTTTTQSTTSSATNNATGTSNSNASQGNTGGATQESYIDSNMTYLQYLKEASLTAKQKKELPASAFGLPKQRRYPMPDEKHVLLAIKFFNHVEPEYESELARNIIKKIKEFKMADKVKVGDKNRFKPYWEKSGLSKTPKKLTEAEMLFSFNVADTLGLYNEQTITGLEEADVKVPDEAKADNPGASSGELSQKISRCFKYNSQATGAKMTQAFAAYKQYIGFYKSVLKQMDAPKKQENTENKEEGQKK